MMKTIRIAFALLLLAVAPVCAQAGTWSLGPNIGLNLLSNQNATQTVISWPGDVGGYMPGLRIGFLRRGAPGQAPASPREKSFQ